MQIKAGTWEGGHNKKATQYFNVIGYLVNRWVGYFVMLITIISLCSTGIAQVVAISTGLYYMDIHISKRSAIANILVTGLQECGNCHASSPVSLVGGWWTTDRQVAGSIHGFLGCDCYNPAVQPAVLAS